MNAFLAEFGKKLADRWIATLAAPGLFFLGALVAAYRLGQTGALDVRDLQQWLSTLVTGNTSAGTVIFWSAIALALGLVLGLTAAALGQLVERLWTVPGGSSFFRRLTERRRAQWTEADGRVGAAREAAAKEQGRAAAGLQNNVRRASAALDKALADRDAISLLEPERPTWVGDRFRAADLRVLRFYDLELRSAWPRLWALVPDGLRADLATARTAYAESARLVGWGVLYAVLACRWWPALAVAAVLATAGWVRSRATAGVLADLVETAVDLHAAELAERLGVTADGTFSTDKGRTVTALLRKDTAADGS
ncbi:hypothetical protein [Streptomyces vastus]|uniref:DUF4407 domain-containing protein n=1 Tax=Streptomyces vastus TaxID=285451 RepID=A0ABN3Q8H2_9ACTN